jgi:hypothetical protein
MDKSDEDLSTGMAFHTSLTTLNKYYNKFNPDIVVCTFDRTNWRKEYTNSDMCLSGKKYKGNRRMKMTPNEEKRYKEFREHIKDFEEFVREHTSMVCMAADMLEADDLMAGIVETYPDDRVITVSADKDLMQLLKFPNARLVDPITDNDRECEDVDWFMFLKCIRGDAGDNVGSAFPRVRETRVRKAFEDEFERLSLMNETVKVNINDEFVDRKVKDLFEENKLLMDLYSQPKSVRKLLFRTINHEMNNKGKYNHFKFIKFCGRHKLKRVIEGVDNYIKLLSS